MNFVALFTCGILQFCLIHCQVVIASEKVMDQEYGNAQIYDLLELLGTKIKEQEKKLRLLTENDSHQTDLINKLMKKNRDLEQSVNENIKEINYTLKTACRSLAAVSEKVLTTVPTSDTRNTTVSNIPLKKTMRIPKSDKERQNREKAEAEKLDRTSRNFSRSNADPIIVSDSPVAFYAYLSANEKVPGPHHILTFDYAKTNIGGAYNHFNGMFTAPTDGIYAFSWSIYCTYRSWAFTEIVVNSDAVGSSLADSIGANADDTSTGFVILELTHSDVVYIRTNPDVATTYDIVSEGRFRTSFSGWKLYLTILLKGPCYNILRSFKLVQHM
ncbi:uncharacterized protein LOC134254713 [Saccostrea cucullata]|uniref:uncharacterized protein LOC134254713 n=1 Tax=Saccostrea cuccullata TaxID=36930 RepID=UPI002ED2A999